ncbi:MAG: hypothetical protein DME86_00655 [Verrucomicrobia bacterium]|nr:MAG: hypothetical protein DME86_00655 [Verrucomicrobiota bacterium]
MNVRNIGEATAWFEILQTTKRTQTAMMTLKPGRSTQRARNRVLHDRVRFMQSGIPIRIERERSADHLARFLVILGADNAQSVMLWGNDPRQISLCQIPAKTCPCHYVHVDLGGPNRFAP